MARTVTLLAKTNLPWTIWKETEPEIFWYFERVFSAWKVDVKFTGDEHTYLLQIDCPNEQVGKMETAFKDNSLATEIDKVHGLDILKKKDVKLSKFQVSLAPALPQNVDARKCIESLEQRIAELELQERSRSIDLKSIVADLSFFQLEMSKKLETLEKHVFSQLDHLSIKCEKMEKLVNKYK